MNYHCFFAINFMAKPKESSIGSSGPLKFRISYNAETDSYIMYYKCCSFLKGHRNCNFYSQICEPSSEAHICNVLLINHQTNIWRKTYDHIFVIKHFPTLCCNVDSMIQVSPRPHEGDLTRSPFRDVLSIIQTNSKADMTRKLKGAGK